MAAKGPALKPGEPLPGTKYRVLRTLGAGGMGVVYQVVKPPNIGGVLKLMSSELTGEKEHRDRFFDEVRILAQLEHPNIVRVFDYDALPDGTPFYVMELLSGRTVRDVVHTMGRVAPRVAYEVTRQLLEALQCAHTHEVPVIHRDIKPENIFLHAPRHGDPVVKLIDFGVSSVADRQHDGQFVGTWSYAAPEQIRGERPTPATDLYAVGLVLYEMLAGVGPFDHHDDWKKVSHAQLTEIPAPVSKFAPWVPASIVTLIASALAKDPKMRPRDAHAFAERLFELEWASDGKDPYDRTQEGHAHANFRARLTRPSPADANANDAGANALEPIDVHGQGPLALVLSSVTGAPRVDSTPLAGSVRADEPTTPDAQVLLAGLGATPRKPISKKERESDPEMELPIASSQRPSNVIVQSGAVGVAAGAPASLPLSRDTFSSQQSDPGSRALPKSRMGVWVGAIALLLIGSVVAIVIVVRGVRTDDVTGAQPTTNVPSGVPSAMPMPTAAIPTTTTTASNAATASAATATATSSTTSSAPDSPSKRPTPGTKPSHGASTAHSASPPAAASTPGRPDYMPF